MSEKVNGLFQDSGGKILTFMLGGQEYGLPIIEAREVIGLMEAESIPQTPEFMIGVINLRGQIIPVVDLRIKFGFPHHEEHNENCILVTKIKERQTGCVIDSLVGVSTVEPDQFEAGLDLGNNIHTEYITGIVKQGSRVIILVNMEEIFKNEELQAIEAAPIAE